MKAQYTKGPWTCEFDEASMGEGHYTIYAENIGSIAFTSMDVNGERENANLIAAAPEMYAELRQMTMFLEDYIRFDKPHSKETAMNFLSNINAAIAKAEGR